ncbi:uncharacterized protein znf839 [Xyrauchen texanus]|uniref:uncharacterized protein znf839 n=1 Tax=Xyrauchen texanus TaxID=154827 RepID=UPI002241E97B|nr:uncharacterized protein znf839 [Xyrauchen texanus]
MADNEDDNNPASKSAVTKIENVEESGSVLQAEATQTTAEGENNQEGSTEPCTVSSSGEGGVDLAELLQSGSGVDVKVVDATQEVIEQIVSGEIITDQNIITSYIQTAADDGMTAECATVSGDVLSAFEQTTTIIYLQPDGSFVESSGLSAEEQKQLIEQLAKHQLVHVTESEVAAKPSITPSVDVQQVIVSEAQVIAQAEPAPTHTTTPKILQKTVTAQPTSYITLEANNLQLATAIPTQPASIVQNASQQLQSVAKQITLQQAQNGAHMPSQKAAEPIQMKVQTPPKQDNKLRQATPIAILQPQNLSAGQPLVKVSTVGTLSSPQIIHITPVPGQQQYFLQNPGDPPIQLLLQKPTPVVGTISVPIGHKVPFPVPPNIKSNLAKPSVAPAPITKVLTPSLKVVSSPAKVVTPTKVVTVATKTSTPVVEKEKPREKNRQKKPQKIKTRSGRVSRPPKHKVKDYKFIKNEDLAESHQSDSDDYSEISVEDEDGEEGRKKTSDMTLNFRDKAFKCETCEKGYIGVAGLSRHYKINPTHDKNQTYSQAEDYSKTREERSEVTDTGHAKSLSTQKVQETAKVEVRRPGRPRGPGRPRRVGRPPKRGRPGRPPKYPRGMTLEQQAQRQRNQLKEFIKQFDDEDLMEIVLPRLARVMTVWEFVMMKVEKGYPSKQQFPSVYHEFEQLHSQVKKMALEYLHTSPASWPAIEVNNMGVLQSLGITDPSVLKLLNSSEGQQSQRTNQATKSFRNIENAKMLPPAKRFKIENCNEETNGFQVNQNGIQKDETVAVLRKPQVVLTRLENLNSVDLTADNGTQSTENDAPLRTEDEPMETEVTTSESDATNMTEDPDPEISKVLNSTTDVDVVDQMKQLEQALSTDVELKTSQEPTQQEVEESQASALEDPMVGDVIQPVGQEESPVIIQTAEGLVMQSAEELAAKGIVIVNGPDGTMMHIEAPEGVPLETVHALLGIETDRKT